MRSKPIKKSGKLLTVVVIAVTASLISAPASMSRGGGGHGGCHGCGHYGGDHDGFGHNGGFGRGLGNHFGLGHRGALGSRLPINHGYFNHMPYRYGWGSGPGYEYYGLGYSAYPNEFFPSYYADGIELGQQISSN